MRIGELSAATGASTRALRYYESQGLLRSQRQSNGYRAFDSDAVRIVAFIQDLYQAGLPSEVIRDVLPCMAPPGPTGDCSALRDRIQKVRDDLAARERSITERRRTLDAYLAGAESPRGVGPTSTSNPE
jgi:DNA-binding transcriptional MerR regulator